MFWGKTKYIASGSRGVVAEEQAVLDDVGVKALLDQVALALLERPRDLQSVLGTGTLGLGDLEAAPRCHCGK